MAHYDKIGSGYNSTRKADPYIASKLFEFLNSIHNGIYLDIGCGTGNYLEALVKKGLSLYGIDPSELMLKQAFARNSGATLIKAGVENLPINGDFFDGAIAVLPLHHWSQLSSGIKEIHRVLKPGSNFVMFSFLPEQQAGYWLCHYFPLMMQKCTQLTKSFEETKEIIFTCGFRNFVSEKYFIKPDLEDHFLYSNKFNAKMYLNESIRNNTSAFSLHSTPEEVKQGITRLREDIRSGEIESIMRRYENKNGDYLFMVATK